MKVWQLREHLECFEPEATIGVTWEGIFRDIQKTNLYYHKDGTVLIDADGNCYKESFQKGTD